MKIKSLLTVFFLITGVIAAIADPPEEGKTIFMTRCAACHNVNKVLTGPALAGVHERRSIEWIVKFVHSSQTLIKGGDKDAVAIFEKFNKVPMPDHPDLTEANIKNVIEYIKTATKISDEKGPFIKPRDLKKSYIPLSLQNDYLFFIGYLVVVSLLATVLWYAVTIKKFQRSPEEDDAA
ncbi:MAG TPA: cytochrome c [Chitinophagaceae bacterium]